MAYITGAITGTVTYQKSEAEPELVKSLNRNRKKQLRFRNTDLCMSFRRVEHFSFLC
jgi:hypothetical protein